MEDNLIHEKYRQLAYAIITQSVDDFLSQYKHIDDYDFYRWCTECVYFDYLNIDREHFYLKVLKLKERGVKKVGGIYSGKNVKKNEDIQSNNIEEND